MCLRQRGWLLPLATSAIATAIFFHRAVLLGRVFVARDILRVYYPLHQYWAARVARGRFPGWYPYDGLGEPFVGMLVGSPFHPVNVLYLALPLATAMTLNILLCFPVAFLGVYLVGRRWGLDALGSSLAAVTYAFGGYLVCITNNLAYLMAAATLPWALWSTDRFVETPTTGRATAAAATLTLVLLAGDPEAFGVACALCAVLAIARHGLRRALLPIVAVLTLTTLFGAVQIVPSLHVAREGKPATQELEAAEAWSTHPLRALDLAFGPMFASESGDIVGGAIDRDLLKTRSNLWVNSVHVGLPAVGLAFVALAAFWRRRRTWALAAPFLVLALLALGKHTPLYALAFRVVPGWRTFRYPEKLVPFCALGLAVAAGAGLQLVQSEEAVRRRAVLAFALTAFACALLAALELQVGLFSRLVATPLWHGRPPVASLGRLGGNFVRWTIASAVVAALVSAALRLVREPRRRGGAIVAIAFIALVVANGPLYEVVSPAVVRPGRFVAAIREAEGAPTPGGWRVYRLKGSYGTDYDRDPELARLDERAQYSRSLQEALDPVTPALWGLEGANKYLPGVSRRVADLADDELEFANRYAALYGVRYLSVSRDDAEDVRGPDLQIVAENPALWLLLMRHAGSRPRAYLTRPRCVRSPAEAFAALSRGLTPDESIVECAAPIAGPAADARPAGKAEIVSYAPERVEIRAEVDSASVLVLNDAFYDGWRATVDGRPEAIVPVNYAVRGVFLGPGAHTALFTYRTPGLVAGASLTGIAVAGATLLCLTRPRALTSPARMALLRPVG